MFKTTMQFFLGMSKNSKRVFSVPDFINGINPTEYRISSNSNGLFVDVLLDCSFIPLPSDKWGLEKSSTHISFCINPEGGDEITKDGWVKIVSGKKVPDFDYPINLYAKLGTP